MFQDNQIIITSNINKKNLLKKNNQKLINIKIYSINEFNKLFYFDYNKETIYYIMTNYNVKYEIAKIYLENLTYIDNTKYDNDKLSFLSSLKKDLIDKKLLKINKLFRNTLKNKDIVFYNLPLTKELSFLIDYLKKDNNVSLNQDEHIIYPHTIYELPSIEDEVEYIANSICNLIKQGISISKIYLTNLSDEYRKIIKRIFPMFNIPYTLDSSESVYSTFICKKFLELYESDLSHTMEQLNMFIDNKESEDIYNKIINIINKYTFIDDKNSILEMIKYDLKNMKLSKKDIPYSVHEVSLKDTIFEEDDYVFTLSFNQGVLPSIYKDESFLTDKDKKDLPISLTVDKNNLEKQIIKDKLNSIKNLTITYKKNANGEDFNISSLNEILNYDVEKINIKCLDNSEINNKLILASLLDEYYKYGTKSDLLNTLNNHYQELPYNTYNHSFTGINPNDLQEYLNNKIVLSYSSLDKYYRCPFSFYIGNILKLNIYEETFYQIVGTLFHTILEKCLNPELKYDELWNKELSNLDYQFNNKEKFFLSKLKEELLFIIETIKDQENFTNLHNELHEERISTSLSGNMKITFTGIIDKIKYKNMGDYTIIAIIDYKTGNPNLDLTTIPYGIGMQLPVYLYLAKNSNKIKNIKVAGFYLQKILNNEIIVDNSHSYEQLKKKNLLLQGYSNENQEILSEFDQSYMDSNIIKSMKTKKDYSFYSYCKVLSDKEMEKITNIAENKINEGAQKISNAEFAISPKKIGKINYGCNLCKFKDICFHTADDIEELEQLILDDILERPKKEEGEG
ncbi:MAG: PD-(D/E)XK nuclease family protein [Candidatus Coprovivens sp.]